MSPHLSSTACLLGASVLLVLAPKESAAMPTEPSAKESAVTESPVTELPDDSTGKTNVQTATLGGKQFWADQLLFHDWRIQRNAMTGHSRLLDGNNARHAWGTFAECQTKLDEIRRERQLPAMDGRAVLVLHGLVRTRGSMGKMCQHLRTADELTVLDVAYPSTRGAVEDHARQLGEVIARLEGLDEVNFVAHSLGNIVIRRWLHDLEDGNAQLPPGAKLGRIVMLAPPNQQPELAEKIVPWDFSGQIAGAAAHELATGWEELDKKLATPPCDFGILAGGNGRAGGNPLLPGDDDWVVSVESTRLGGARDFRVLPVRHTFMMNDPQLQSMTLRFLEEGHFESADSRQPIPAEAEIEQRGK